MLVGLASAMFVGLFGFGAAYFGWSDPDGKVQLALFTAFVLGIVSGYKTRGRGLCEVPLSTKTRLR